MFKLRKSKAKSNNKTSKKPTKARKKGEKSTRKRVDTYPIISSLKLQEIVPSIVTSELERFADEGDGAVRRIGDGFTVIVIDHDTLDASGFTDDKHNSGQLAAAIRGETIRLAALPADINKGLLAFIPDSTTLFSLDEYDAFREGMFTWGIFSNDYDDGSLENEIFVGNGKVSLAQLIEIGENGLVVDSIDRDYDSSGTDAESMPEEETPVETSEDDYPDVDDIEDIEDVEDIDTTHEPAVEFDEPIPDMPENDDNLTAALLDEIEEEEYEEEESMVVEGLEAEHLSIDNADEDDVDELDEETANLHGQEDEFRKVIVADEFVASIRELEERRIYDGDLDLDVDASLFNELFTHIQPFRFALRQEDGSSLTRVLNEKSITFNGELARLRETNMQQLSQMFAKRMQDGVRHVQNSFDLENGQTESGDFKQRLEASRDDLLSKVGDFVDMYAQTQDDKYNENREEYMKNVAEQAGREYDDKHKQGHEQDKANARPSVLHDIEQKHAHSMNGLNERRQRAATQMLTQIHANIMNGLQNVYEQMITDEDAIRANMVAHLDDYTKSNFNDETMRAEALAEQLRQETEADRVRRDYEVRLAENVSRIEMLQHEADESLALAKSEHRTYVIRLEEDHKARMKAKEDEIEEGQSVIQGLRADTARLHDEIASTSERKEFELKEQYKGQIEQLNASIDNQQKLLDSIERDKEKKHKSTIMSTIIASIATLALGCTGTFAYMASQEPELPPQVNVPAPIVIQSDGSKTTETPKTEATLDSSDLDAYVATPKAGKGSSLIVEFKDDYKKGETLDVLGQLDDDNQTSTAKTAKVTAVDEHTVTLRDSDKQVYTFTKAPDEDK